MARRLVPARPTNWPESVMAGNDTGQRHRAGGEAPGAANGWPELPPGAAWQWPAWPAGADSGRQQFPGVARDLLVARQSLPDHTDTNLQPSESDCINMKSMFD